MIASKLSIVSIFSYLQVICHTNIIDIEKIQNSFEPETSDLTVCEGDSSQGMVLLSQTSQSLRKLLSSHKKRNQHSITGFIIEENSRAQGGGTLNIKGKWLQTQLLTKDAHSHMPSSSEETPSILQG